MHNVGLQVPPNCQCTHSSSFLIFSFFPVSAHCSFCEHGKSTMVKFLAGLPTAHSWADSLVLKDQNDGARTIIEPWNCKEHTNPLWSGFFLVACYQITALIATFWFGIPPCRQHLRRYPWLRSSKMGKNGFSNSLGRGRYAHNQRFPWLDPSDSHTRNPL